MKSLIYICPYFGKLPKNFQLWLDTCKYNSTINWLIFTDDKDTYDYPINVKVIYLSFEELRKKIQSKFDFTISLEKPYKLCDFKPAYGYIFSDFIIGFDFWGHCDMDVFFGNIRKFLNNQILSNYEKIGYQGHSTIYLNNDIVNSRFKTITNKFNYKDIFSSNKNFAFDEIGMDDIYLNLNIKVYQETIFAHLDKYSYGFRTMYLHDESPNKRSIFVWKDGNIYQYYLVNDKIKKIEYYYLHYFCRPLSFKVTRIVKGKIIIIYPDKVIESSNEPTIKFIKRHGKKGAIRYYLSSIWYNRHKITFKKIVYNIKAMIRSKKASKYEK